MSLKSTLGVAAIFVATIGVGFVIARSTQRVAVKADRSHVVELLADHASPSAIAITKGDYVQFSTKDGKLHNIGQGKGDDEVDQAAHIPAHDHPVGAKESGNFGVGEAYRVQFNQTGTFDFHDHLQPKISVTVIVYDKSKKS